MEEKCTAVEGCEEPAVAEGLCYDCLNDHLYNTNSSDFPAHLLDTLGKAWWGWPIEEVCR